LKGDMWIKEEMVGFWW